VKPVAKAFWIGSATDTESHWQYSQTIHATQCQTLLPSGLVDSWWGRQCDSRAELHHASGEHQITCCESGKCGQQTMQAIQGMATRT